MPVHSPFTTLCQALAPARILGRGDLHVHTTHSDGSYTPMQVVALARRLGLAALAITDHDTTGGVAAARSAAAGSDLDIISGVEITAEHELRELHLLGYFIRLDDVPLQAALERLRQHRQTRYREMIDRLKGCGVTLDEALLTEQVAAETLGRRHLAEALVRSGQTGSIREAFARYLGDQGPAMAPKLRLPVAEAIALVQAAGGVTSWAHPSFDHVQERLTALRLLGLQAVEVDSPGKRPAQVKSLRTLAAGLGMAVSGGSDCHGPDEPRQALGSHGVSGEELDVLRRLARR